jgi:hypothetical protein
LEKLSLMGPNLIDFRKYQPTEILWHAVWQHAHDEGEIVAY